MPEPGERRHVQGSLGQCLAGPGSGCRAGELCTGSYSFPAPFLRLKIWKDAGVWCGGKSMCFYRDLHSARLGLAVTLDSPEPWMVAFQLASEGARLISVNATEFTASLTEAVQQGVSVWANEPVQVQGYYESHPLLKVMIGEVRGMTAFGWLCARMANRFALCCVRADQVVGRGWSTRLSGL